MAADGPITITDAGKKIGLNRFVNIGSVGSIKQSEVNIVYAINELGEATHWTKLYNNGGKFTQLWIDEFHRRFDEPRKPCADF